MWRVYELKNKGKPKPVLLLWSKLTDILLLSALFAFAACVPLQPGETSLAGSGDEPAMREMASGLSVSPYASEQEIAENSIECDKLRGKYERQGLLGSYMCVLTYSDAGKICSSGAQCAGECVTQYTNDADGPPTGQCKATTSPFGCYAVIDDNGQLQSMICRD